MLGQGVMVGPQFAELSLEYLPAEKPCGRPPVFLLHGWGHSRQCWRTLIPVLMQEQDVYSVDLPGFGDNADWQLPALNDTLTALARLLPDQCVLMGWSLGGHLALRLAAHYPHKVAGVITLATNLSFVASADWPHAMPPHVFEDFTQQFAQAPSVTFKRFCGLQAQGDRHRKALLKDLREECSPPQPEQLAQWQAALTWLGQINHREELAGLTQPLLQMFGGEDALVPAIAAQAIQRMSSGTVVTIADAGHAPHLTHAEEVAEHLCEFLNKLKGSSTTILRTGYPQIDKQRMARSFSRAAETYDSAAHVQTQVGERLLQQSPVITPGETLLDIGCGTGFCSEYFCAKDAEVTGLDIAPGMLKKARQKSQKELSEKICWVCADAEHLPFPENYFTGAVSNLTVQWSGNLPQLFSGLSNCLKPGGWFLFSTLGPDTLHELRSAWSAVDTYAHVNNFTSAIELKRALNDAGMNVELFTEEKIVPRYEQLNPLLHELKALGAHNVNVRQNRGLMAPRYLRQLVLAYEKFRSADDKLPATYQVFYVMARKPQQ